MSSGHVKFNVNLLIINKALKQIVKSFSMEYFFSISFDISYFVSPSNAITSSNSLHPS